jgi:flagellar biogenesis protein FliO
MGYLANFIVYTLAMLGVIILALFVYKYTTGVKVKSNGKTQGLRVIDTLTLSPRKTLYVVETHGEKFLIAGDAERTALISKLNTTSTPLQRQNVEIRQETEDYSDKKNLGIYSTQKAPYNSVMRSLAEKMNSIR